ncbi:MAG: KamA family radical SAM protein [Candidatus Latescibacteria bacterium]|nr:KamA family radical SAM protein [Candidatus Latescibacterota bacterium]NIM22300.1 KamA family radical SAM protein [Candidatus Latescibacterota bacterium]NIM66129.1 KamA family radical SAM protein [Candidatus Latescibacterota bacterium]NIO02537.1 KamA family radical SAM protein [Candidatus Latescibacterota bacterium]NIO29451.1 KamA family radical SAM protein [Candidatus Latescibacterota bacterium]
MFMRRPKYITKLEQIPQLSDEERRELEQVKQNFAFRTNEYYQSLINWNDLGDPIRRIIMPDVEELFEWGELDASCEADYTKVPGLEHKYDSVGLLLVNDVCGGYCRFCFRKRLFMDENDEVVKDISQGLEYIREHDEITNVLLTGGDPLIMSTGKLEKIISEVRDIDHVQIIRIGTKIPAFNPFRIIDDPALLDMFKKYSTPEKRIYVVVHFNHPRELTKDAIEGLDLLQQAGVITVNQTPLIRGVNDDPDTLAELFRKCSFVGVPPYYVFQCRPTLGNKSYAVPIEEAYQIFELAKENCSGLAFRARYVMSHHSGKIEVVGLINSNIIFKYHRAANPADTGRVMVFKRNPFAYWFDDYQEAVDHHSFGSPLA